MNTTPVPVSADADCVCVEFTDYDGVKKHAIVTLHSLRGQGVAAAKVLAAAGADIPIYGTQERRNWAASLRGYILRAAGVVA